jgi:hypothetical protein
MWSGFCRELSLDQLQSPEPDHHSRIRGIHGKKALNVGVQTGAVQRACDQHDHVRAHRHQIVELWPTNIETVAAAGERIFRLPPHAAFGIPTKSKAQGFSDNEFASRRIGGTMWSGIRKISSLERRIHPVKSLFTSMVTQVGGFA